MGPCSSQNKHQIIQEQNNKRPQRKGTFAIQKQFDQVIEKSSNFSIQKQMQVNISSQLHSNQPKKGQNITPSMIMLNQDPFVTKELDPPQSNIDPLASHLLIQPPTNKGIKPTSSILMPEEKQKAMKRSHIISAVYEASVQYFKSQISPNQAHEAKEDNPDPNNSYSIDYQFDNTRNVSTYGNSKTEKIYSQSVKITQTRNNKKQEVNCPEPKDKLYNTTVDQNNNEVIVDKSKNLNGSKRKTNGPKQSSLVIQQKNQDESLFDITKSYRDPKLNTTIIEENQESEVTVLNGTGFKPKPIAEENQEQHSQISFQKNKERRSTIKQNASGQESKKSIHYSNTNQKSVYLQSSLVQPNTWTPKFTQQRKTSKGTVKQTGVAIKLPSSGSWRTQA